MVHTNDESVEEKAWSLTKEKRFLDGKVEWFQKQGKPKEKICEFLYSYLRALELRSLSFDGEGPFTSSEKEKMIGFVEGFLYLLGGMN